MKVIKKFLAVLCSATLIVSAPVTAFAADGETAAGTGNVLAYSKESVIVPTSIQVALNPAQYTVTVRPDATDDTKTTNDQIVTFNYGIANKSTADKVVNVEFKVTGSPDATKTPITFVDSADKASAKTTENTSGAEAGELKMYLAVVGSQAAPTAGDDAFEVTAVADGANTENATAGNLCDVKMSNASSGSVAFAPKGDYYAYAETAFSLGKATYDVQDNLSIDFDTTQSDLAEKMEMTALGDVTGFTIIGAMNKNADWTKADVSVLTFAPIYDFTVDATGNEIAAGGYKQVKTASEVAAGAAGTFLTAHGDVVALLGDLTAVTGTEAEMGKIDAAIEAYESITDTAVIAALTANDPSVTADTLGALKDASAAKATGDANASAAAAFKSTYSEVLTLTVDTVEGTAEELEAINAAGIAFDALDDAVKTILADDGIDAEFFTDLAAASEEAATPAVVEYQLELNTTNQNLTYTFTSSAPTGSVEAMKLNGVTKGAGQISQGNITYSSNKVIIKSAAVTALGIQQGDKIVLTIGGNDYNFKY